MRKKGYVITTVRKLGGKTELIDPNSPEQVLTAITATAGQLEIGGFFCESLSMFRRIRIEQLGEAAELFPEYARKLKKGEVERWGLRPMQMIEVVGNGDDLSVISVEGMSDPKDVKAFPYYGDFRLKDNDYASQRIAIERIRELADSTDPSIQPAQLRDIREKGVELLRILSYFAPFMAGNFTKISGLAKSGKTTLLRMIFYLYRWLLLEEEPNSVVVFLDVGERSDELSEAEKLAEGHPRIEFFGTSVDDIPTSKWVITGLLSLERVKRLLEIGKDVIFFIDSLFRLGVGFTLNAEAQDRGASGGHSLSALIKPREFVGVGGTYHPSPEDMIKTVVCTVIATSLKGFTSWDNVIEQQLSGTSDADVDFFENAREHPKLQVSQDEATSTRNLTWGNFTPLERWFMDQLRRRTKEAGFENGKACPWNCIEFLKKTFLMEGPQEVMRKWWNVERKNQLYLTFRTDAGTNIVLVDQWNLELEEVKALFAAGVDSNDVQDLANAGVNQVTVRQLLKKELSLKELLAILQAWRQAWSNQAYTDALNLTLEKERGTLSNQTCEPLRQAGIGAKQFSFLLGKGYEVGAIKVAAVNGADHSNIEERLRLSKAAREPGKDGDEDE